MEAVKSVESQGIGLREGEGKRRGTSTRLPVNSSNGQGLKVLFSRLDEKTTKRLGRFTMARPRAPFLYLRLQ